MASDLVSIITPVFNAEDYLKYTIESVLEQTYNVWELLLVDDQSTDHSQVIAQEFAAKDSRIKFFQTQKNSGPAVTRNLAIQQSKGRFITFLDSDDLWHPEKLNKQVSFMLSNQLALSHSYYAFIDSNGNLTGKTIQPPVILTYKDILYFNFIGCLTAMYDTYILGKVFMPEIDKRQDYALWLKIMRNSYHAYALEETLAYYRSGKKSLSSNKWNSALYNYKILTEFEGLPHHKALYYFLHYIAIGLRKYIFT